uniref:Uncharacterized protein n=1 Tax=Paramormyrops kingsleyae TaxID=1676925 RepID=A0A3B3SUM5_9TELE
MSFLPEIRPAFRVQILMAAAWPVPCPVRGGTVRDGGMAARLHQHTLDRNLRKMEKLLKKGELTQPKMAGCVDVMFA